MGMKHARKRNTLVDKLVVRYLYNILWHIVYPYVLWGCGGYQGAYQGGGGRGMQKAKAASFMYFGIGLLCFHLAFEFFLLSLNVSCFGF